MGVTFLGSGGWNSTQHVVLLIRKVGGRVDLVDGAAQLQKLPPWPTLDAMAPTCALHTWLYPLIAVETLIPSWTGKKKNQTTSS